VVAVSLKKYYRSYTNPWALLHHGIVQGFFIAGHGGARLDLVRHGWARKNFTEQGLAVLGTIGSGVARQGKLYEDGRALVKSGEVRCGKARKTF
jgi:hypothetical protein